MGSRTQGKQGAAEFRALGLWLSMVMTHEPHPAQWLDGMADRLRGQDMPQGSRIRAQTRWGDSQELLRA